MMDPGIHALDSGYARRGFDAIHLVEGAKCLAVVDSGTVHSVPRVLAALQSLGHAPEAVEWVLLTHVHLDHAGGAGALLQALPNAQLLVHPRGVRHMVDPSRLWAGALAVYGEQFARTAYGELVPAPRQRVVAAEEGMVIELGGRMIEVMDTPGHARHHLCFFDVASQAWFTGDTFGLSYRETHVGERAFVFPTTTPVQFDPDALHASIDRLCRRNPRAMYLTHYSRVTGVPRLAADLHRLIDAFVCLGESARGLAGAGQYQALRAGLADLLCAEAAQQGWAVQADVALELYAADLDLNAQGLQVWLTS